MNGYPIWFCLALLISSLTGVFSGCSLAYAFASGRIKRGKKRTVRKTSHKGLRGRMHRQDNDSFSAFRSFEREEDHSRNMYCARGSQDDSYAYISKGCRFPGHHPPKN